MTASGYLSHLVRLFRAAVVRNSPSALALSLTVACGIIFALAPSANAEEDEIADNFTITTTYGNAAEPAGEYGASTAPTDEGAFRFECEISHLGYDDPIVYPGQPGVSHLHHFFGNTSANAYSSYSILRQNGGGTCAGGRANRSGYWFPAVIDPGNVKVRKPDFITVYYKTDRGEVADSVYIPRGLRLISGYDFANPGTDISTIMHWGCEDGSTVGMPQTIAAISPACPSNQRIFVRLDFPRCWDTVNLDTTNHRDHMSFGTAGACPSGWKFIPGITTIIVWFSHDGSSDYSTWYLSSDRFNGLALPGGTSFHSDWWGAWSPTVTLKWQDHCDGMTGLQPDIRSGVGGHLCTNDVVNAPNGEALRWDVLGPAFNETLSLAAETGASRLLDIP
jgi:hypothetical protein